MKIRMTKSEIRMNVQCPMSNVRRQKTLDFGLWTLVIISSFWLGHWSLVHAGLSDIGITPLRTELGARPLGMGGAYVAVADDPNAAFYNPGGLPFAKGIAVTADQDFSNIAASQAYPTGYGGTLGLAIISSRIRDIPLPAGSSSSTSGNTLVFSYGQKLGEKIGLGLNIKYLLWQTIQQIGQLDQSASGLTADLGIFFKASDWLTLGLAGTNLLGGELSWRSGAEKITSGAKLGAAAKIIGDVKSPIYMEGKELLLSTELEYQQLRTYSKVGAEFNVEGRFFLRGGYAPQGAGLSYGLGLRWEGWGLDLTSAIEETKNEHRTYLSLLYFPKEWVFVKKEIPAWEVIGVPIEKISLEDNLITYEEKLDVFGRVKPEVEVYINSTPVYVASDGVFRAQVPLLSGKNLVVVEARYHGDKKTYEYKVLRKAKVLIAEEKQKLTEEKKKEVTERKEKLEALVTMGVVEVRPEVEFELESKVSRGELATWIVRAAGIPVSAVTQNVFKDIPKDHPLAFYIKTVTDLKLMSPYPDGTFRPKQPVTEAEGREIFRKFGVIK